MVGEPGAAPLSIDARRVLRFLKGGDAALEESASGQKVILASENAGRIATMRRTVAELVEAGGLRLDGGRLGLSDRGRSILAAQGPQGRAAAPEKRPSDAEGRSRGPQRLPAVNADESPLAQVGRLRTRDGRAFLEEAEFRAGERLRSDYTRAMIMPRLGANWEAAVASERRRSGSGAGAELTDAAIAARLRVEKALVAVGPDLAGVLIDICCFLKGLSIVEIERGWPVRSAKVVLKTGLAALARHYEPAATSRGGRILNWGAEGYRPALRSSGDAR